VNGGNRGCVASGRFEVFEAEYTPGGELFRFSADFLQRCDGVEPALRGRIRYRAAFRPEPRDRDGDGWRDGEDNCPEVANPVQRLEEAERCGLDPAARRCVVTQNRGGAGLARLQGAAGLACLRNAAAGAVHRLGTPATAQHCLTNDAAQRIESAAGRMALREADTCEAPPPRFGFSASAAARDAAVEEGAALVADLFGPDLDVALIGAAADPAGARCQADVLARTGALQKRLFARALALKKAALAGRSEPAATSRETLAPMLLEPLAQDPGGGYAKARAALAGAAARRCGGQPDLAAAFPGCAAADVPTLAACAERAARCRFCRMLAAFDALSLDCDGFDDGAADASCPAPPPAPGR